MNFNFQPVNEQSAANSHPPLPSGDMGYFSASLRAGYSGLSNIRFTGHFPNPIDSSVFIQREMENARIREIILAEVVRRRMFDEELQRELMLNRHLTLNAPLGGFLSSPSMLSNHNSSYPLPSQTRSLEEILPFSLEKRQEFPEVEVSRLEGSEPVQFQRSSEPKDNPTLNLSGLKRKAELPLPIGSDVVPTPAKKMVTMNELNYCAICQIGATSKENLEQHNNGKKHKSNVLKLRQKEGKNCEIGFFPKTTVEKPEMNTTVEKPEMNTTVEKPEMKTTVEKPEMNTTVEKHEMKTTVEKQEMKTGYCESAKVTDLDPACVGEKAEERIKLSGIIEK